MTKLNMADELGDFTLDEIDAILSVLVMERAAGGDLTLLAWRLHHEYLTQGDHRAATAWLRVVRTLRSWAGYHQPSRCDDDNDGGHVAS